ncbi:MAG: polysaccharide biosynthesis/export family protein [Bacteroidales bacterium]|nr:polysaccharide biosynthesis/export family protein [Bacteroidales bacterium]
MKKLILFLLVVGILSSCSKYKDLVYFNQANLPDTTYQPEYVDFSISKGDLIYFTVHSINKEINSIFNDATSSNMNYAYSKANLFIKGYTVDNTGEVSLPFIGKVAITGLTVDSAEAKIQSLINEYFNDVTIKVKFVSFNLTILGEVNSPGFYSIYDRNFNILEALGMAKDISVYGDRKQIKVIHQNVDGITTEVIDLTSDDVFSGRKFFLQPNDIIYVPPRKNKNFRLNAPNISIILSSITTLVLVLNFIIK